MVLLNPDSFEVGMKRLFNEETVTQFTHRLKYLKKQPKEEMIRQNQPMLLFNPLHIKTFFILFICFLHKVV